MITEDPEFFNIKQLKDTGVWDTYTFLSFYGMAPYLKRIKGDITGVEIGVLKGENVYKLLTECPNIKKIYGVDPYVEHTDYQTTRIQADMDKYKKVAEENLAEFDDRYELVEKKSVDAAKDFQENTFDFILVDGDHSYESILADLESWYPLLKKGGYIFIHDVYVPHVLNAIKDYKNKYKIRTPLNTSKNYVSFWIKV